MLEMDSAEQYEQNEVLHDYVNSFIEIFMCCRGVLRDLILWQTFWAFKPVAELVTQVSFVAYGVLNHNQKSNFLVLSMHMYLTIPIGKKVA